MSFDQQFTRVQSLLTAELQVPVDKALALRRKERGALKQQLSELVQMVHSLVKQFKRLPQLPDPVQIRWAQSVLALDKASILTLDATSSSENSTILRVLMLDLSDNILLDHTIVPGYILSAHTMQIWGITPLDLQNALSLPQVWSALLDTLMGRYVVCYDLERVRKLLEEHSQQYELEPPVILGDCLLHHLLHYFQSTGFVGLPALCRHIGYPLPEPPDCTILDRARGQLHLLRAMAQGIAGGGSQPSFNEKPNDDDLEKITL